MIHSVRAAAFLLLLLVAAALLSYLVVHNVNIPSWIDGVRIKTYLFLICILLFVVVCILIWWAVYLPTPERWYLACARVCLFLFVGSGCAIIGDLGIKYFAADMGKMGNVTGLFHDSGYERIGVFLVSVICLDIFSRKYVKYR